MKRSSGRRRVRVGPRRETDWLAYSLDDSDFAVGPGLSQVQGYSLIDPTDMLVKDGKVTVERVVGDFMLFGGKDAVGANVNGFLVWAAGLIVLEADQTAAVVFLDPDGAVDMEASWLWLAHGSYGSLQHDGTELVPDFGHWVHLDVHVRRKMTERDQLVLFLHVQPLVGGAITSTNGSFRFRTLVKLT